VTAKKLRIDIVSDTLCPWCFIGKRRLERALEILGQPDREIFWHPFQLDATIPPEGIDRQLYLTRKFGEEGAKKVYARVEQAGAEEGIAFAFDKIRKSPNTLDSHRVIRWATHENKQNEVAERLFSLIFVEGADIGDKDVLAGAARDVGMDSDEVCQKLQSDVDLEDVKREVEEAHRLGIGGVPAFIIANAGLINGAQPAEGLAEAITQITAEQEQQGAAE